MNTEAEVTVISEDTFHTLESVLERPPQTLYGPARHHLDLLGQFTEELVHRKSTHMRKTCLWSVNYVITY